MTYQNKFVAVIKSNGAILREKDGIVKLPFGSEYSILLKNLESRKACVRITVDGEDVLMNNSLILNSNGDIELEGFLGIQNGIVVTNKFKFTKKTEQVVKHRGDKVDDGIIRVEYWFEQIKHEEVIDVIRRHGWDWHPWYPYRPWYPEPYYLSPYKPYWIYESPNTTTGRITCDTNKCSASFATSQLPEINPDEGITVKGSISSQSFSVGVIKELEENSHVIIIQLRGYTSEGVRVDKPVTVKTKLECPTCGTKSKSDAVFCSHCGTALDS